MTLIERKALINALPHIMVHSGLNQEFIVEVLCPEDLESVSNKFLYDWNQSNVWGVYLTPKGNYRYLDIYQKTHPLFK